MKPSFLFIPLMLCLLISAAHGQKVGETVSTLLESYAESAKGSHLRQQVNALVAMVRAKKLPEAEIAATDLRKQFELSFNTKMRQYTFQSKEEYLEFKNASPQEFEWIDWGYEECLQMQAFILAERRDFQAALAILSAIETVAPVSAGTAAERGYILAQLGKPEDARTAYTRALSLSTSYRSQQPFRAIAMRGIGFALIELQRIDEAESIFQQSLEIEPNNKVALSELAYIRELRVKR